MEFLLIAIILGLIPAAIAQSKGRSFVAWWIYGAALFIVALPHALLIKPDVEQIEREQLQSGTARKCPFCAEIIKAEAVVCRFCGRDLPRVELPLPDDFRTAAKEYGFHMGNPQGDREMWYGMLDLDLYLSIQNGRWQVGSWNPDTTERIKKTLGYLDLETSSSLTTTNQGVSGDRAIALSTMLKTLQWLVAKETEATKVQQELQTENQTTVSVNKKTSPATVFLLVSLLGCVVLIGRVFLTSKSTPPGDSKVESVLPDTTLPLSASRESNTTDEYEMLVERYGKPDSMLSTENDKPKPKVVTRIVRYKTAHTKIVLAPNGCLEAYDTAMRVLAGTSHPLSKEETRRMQRCVALPGWTIVGYIDISDNHPISAQLAGLFLGRIADKRTADPVVE